MARASHLPTPPPTHPPPGLCQQHFWQYFLFVGFLSHTEMGGWSSEKKPGIIKCFEWQTLDVLMAAVSHSTLLGVPQPPSLLTVIAPLCITCPKSHPQIVHLMLIEAWIPEPPRGIHIQFQHHGCATWLFMFGIQFMFNVSISMYGDVYPPVLLCNCDWLSVVTQALCKWSTTQCQEFFVVLTSVARAAELLVAWRPFLINHRPHTAWSPDNPQPAGLLPSPMSIRKATLLWAHRKKAMQQWQLLVVIWTGLPVQFKPLTSHSCGFGFHMSWVHRFWSVGAKVSRFARLSQQLSTTSAVMGVGQPWRQQAGSTAYPPTSFWRAEEAGHMGWGWGCGGASFVVDTLKHVLGFGLSELMGDVVRGYFCFCTPIVKSLLGSKPALYCGVQGLRAVLWSSCVMTM